MDNQKAKYVKGKKRAYRVRNKQNAREKKIRISVFRSLKHIYAQIIDDNEHKTLVSFSSMKLDNAALSKKEIAKQVGLALAKKAVEKNIDNVFFDRGRFLYHGRVQALVEGLREGGMNL